MFTEFPTELRRRLTRYSHDPHSYNLSGGFARGMEEGRVDADASELHEIDVGARTLLVTDAASDLPAEWRVSAGVLVLPIKLKNGEMSRIDNGDEEAAMRFATKHAALLNGSTHTLAASIDTTAELISQHATDDTDFVLQIAMSSMRSNSYANALTAAQKLMAQGSRERRRAGNSRPFKMWVVDSGASFNGHGVLIAECARLLDSKVPVPQMVQQVDGLRRRVHTIVVPRDLKLFHRSAALPDAPVSRWVSRNIGQLFDRIPVALATHDELRVIGAQRGFALAATLALNQVIRCVEAGLDAPFVCASYAGDIADLAHIQAVSALAVVCSRHSVTLLIGTMSMTNVVLLGGGSLSISFAAPNFKG